VIHFHCYQHEAIAYTASFDPSSGALTLSGALSVDLSLTVADIRTRYGEGDLLVYVSSDPAGSITTGVFPGEQHNLSDARKTFLKDLWSSRHLLLMAELPAGTSTWLDPSVRVVSIYAYTDPLEGGHGIEVSSNEPSVTTLDFRRYLQDNPLRIAWAIEKGTVIHAQGI